MGWEMKSNFPTGFSIHYAFWSVQEYIKTPIETLQEQAACRKLILYCQSNINVLRKCFQSLVDWSESQIRQMSEKVVLDNIYSLNPEQRCILACTGYEVWTWYRAFLTAFPHPLSSGGCLAFLSVILIVVLALTASSSLLEPSLEGVWTEPRFEFYGKKEIQTERTIVFLLLSWDACSCHTDIGQPSCTQL